MTEALDRVLAEPRQALGGRTDRRRGARSRAGRLVRHGVGASVHARSVMRSTGGSRPRSWFDRSMRRRTGFDARSSASAREYRYRIDVGDVPDPFTARFVWHHPCAPDLRAMRAPRDTWWVSTTSRRSAGIPGQAGPPCDDLQRVSVTAPRGPAGARIPGERVPASDGAGAHGDARRRRRREARPGSDPGDPRGPGPSSGAAHRAAARPHPRTGRLRSTNTPMNRADAVLPL